MFRYGGPIKEGVMSGIREPKKNGGLSKQFNTGLVGDERYPKTDGREHHLAFLAPLYWAGQAALRAAPAIYRGYKAGRFFGPGKLGKMGRLKDTFLGSGRFRDVTLKKPPSMKSKPWIRETIPGKRMGILQALKDPQRFGMAMREYPITALTAATLPATAVDLTREHGKDVAKGGWNLIKRFGAAVIPGDQSSWYKDKPPVKDVPLNPNLQKNLQKEAAVEEAAAEEAALAKRQKALNERIKKYRDIMDIKGMNKQAAYKSLVDASKLIQESGDFKGDIKSGKLINQVIQAASKQFDKPAQASKAVDTLILKGEIEKDIKADDPSAQVLTELRGLQGKKIIKELNPDLNTLIAGYSKDNKGQSGINLAIEQYAKNLGYDYKGNIISKSDFKDTLKDLKTKTKGLDEDLIIKNYTEEVIKNQDAPDGAYSVGDKMVIIKDNQVIAVE
jgi:hypothetical protein